MSETTRMRAPYFELQMGAGPSLLLDELRILRERNEQQHADLAGLRAEVERLHRVADTLDQAAAALNNDRGDLAAGARRAYCNARDLIRNTKGARHD